MQSADLRTPLWYRSFLVLLGVGAIIGAIANALSIIFLGLLRDTHKNHRSNTSAV